MQEKVATKAAPKRRLVSQAALREAEQMLTELFEIEFSIGEVKDKVRDVDEPLSEIVSPI